MYNLSLDGREPEAIFVSIKSLPSMPGAVRTISPGLTCPETSFKIVYSNCQPVGIIYYYVIFTLLCFFCPVNRPPS